MTDKEKAQEAWKLKCQTKILDTTGMSSGILQKAVYEVVSDYKQALKKEIEKEKVCRGVSGHYADGRTWAFEKVLELLDTVKPVL